MVLWFLSLNLILWLITLVDLWIFSHSCICRDEVYFIMVGHLLDVFLSSVCKHTVPNIYISVFFREISFVGKSLSVFCLSVFVSGNNGFMETIIRLLESLQT